MHPRHHHLSTSVNVALLGLAACLFAIACGGSSRAVQPAGVPALYGDGSAGAFVAPPGASTLSDFNTQYTSFTVGVGNTLTVRSGTVLHCTGTVTISGTVTVNSGSDGGFITAGTNITANTVVPLSRIAGQGAADSVAGNGEVGNTSATLAGGLSGSGQGFADGFVHRPLHNAGGAGGGACGAPGGSGGGGFSVFAFGAISVPVGGLVAADGSNGVSGGGGGGAGGVIVLASAVSVSVAGAVTANGGDGSVSDTDSGAGGGGGGGIVNVIAPVITGAAGPNYKVLPGGSGSPGAAGSVSDPFRSGGGGGGGCGGSGATGGGVSAADTPASPALASGGDANLVLADPTGQVS